MVIRVLTSEDNVQETVKHGLRVLIDSTQAYNRQAAKGKDGECLFFRQGLVSKLGGKIMAAFGDQLSRQSCYLLPIQAIINATRTDICFICLCYNQSDYTSEKKKCR